MRSFSDLIVEWLNGHPSRTCAALSRLTKVSTAEISLIRRGRIPSIDIAIRLGAVLPAMEIRLIMCEANPSYQKFFRRLSSVDVAG